jgi:hypothetical protein
MRRFYAITIAIPRKPGACIIRSERLNRKPYWADHVRDFTSITLDPDTTAPGNDLRAAHEASGVFKLDKVEAAAPPEQTQVRLVRCSYFRIAVLLSDM